MITNYIDIPDNKWGIVVVYDFDVYEEKVELLAIMRSFGITQYDANRALDILKGYNTGMAISLDDLRMSVIFISHASSTSEFYSTAIHELIHVSNAILDYYGETWDGEPSAYLVGYLTKELVEIVGQPCI